MTRTDLICSVCRRHRANLRPRKSKLLPSLPTLLLCGECFEAKREPRFAVIMVARDPHQGLDVVKDYLKNHRYYGEKIRADELV